VPQKTAAALLAAADASTAAVGQGSRSRDQLLPRLQQLQQLLQLPDTAAAAKVLLEAAQP